MKKNIITLSALLGSLLIIGCGGESETSTFKGTYTVNGVKHTCTTEESYDACRGGDCSDCTNDAPSTTTQTEVSECKTSGNTVLVDEGTTCKNGSDTLSCSGNKVTLNNSMTAQTIQINGKTYTCQ